MIQSFYVISIDRTRKMFYVSDPVKNDELYIDKCSELQKKGYNCICDTVYTTDDTKENLIKYFQNEGLTLVDFNTLYSI